MAYDPRGHGMIQDTTGGSAGRDFAGGDPLRQVSSMVGGRPSDPQRQASSMVAGPLDPVQAVSGLNPIMPTPPPVPPPPPPVNQPGYVQQNVPEPSPGPTSYEDPFGIPAPVTGLQIDYGLGGTPAPPTANYQGYGHPSAPGPEPANYPGYVQQNAPPAAPPVPPTFGPSTERDLPPGYTPWGAPAPEAPVEQFGSYTPPPGPVQFEPMSSRINRSREMVDLTGLQVPRAPPPAQSGPYRQPQQQQPLGDLGAPQPNTNPYGMERHITSGSGGWFGPGVTAATGAQQ